ncbi:cyclopropane-fatty-acyl-phospholipid synthase [Irpex rosettiformis]|uniref:Cyclopropane-fatty-acyl-phospholipid synthase n=1 Tax=Irpex rosettiformis TaxID=378272 RepID=A0ACB8TYQ6_9APHY|nr:cyclopropane-fatty-acyl-phospholipid synthase [Irpex rosettiformis]
MSTTTTTVALRVHHQRSVLNTLSKLWAASSQATVYALAKSHAVSSLVEGAVVKALQGIAVGKLLIVTPDATYHFPFQPAEGREEKPVSFSRSYSDDPQPEAKIIVKNKSFFLRLAASPDIGFSEAYMFGDIDVETDRLKDIFRIFILNSRANALNSLTSSALTRLFSLPARITAGRFVASLQNAQPNISAHYDLGNDIFEAFLSRDMTYSCAIFPSLDADLKLGMDRNDVSLNDLDDTQLHEGQQRKLRHIIAKADIRPGYRILEIGSGWGSLSFLITQTIEDTTVDTITLSVQQETYVRQKIAEFGLEDKVKVHLMDYRAMPPEWESAFDRVVSVEMIEAVGKEYIETYFAKIDWALKQYSGVAVIQGITIPEARFEEYAKTEDFILFPGGLLPTVTYITSAINAASSGRLLVESISNIGPHYARTLREWRKRFDAGFRSSPDGQCGVIVKALREEFPEVMDGPRGEEEIEVFRRKWLYYFCYCEAGFTMRMLGVHILTIIREGNVEYGCQTFA